ncbi:MAG: Gfo/Idh/MocA family protein [Anaerohalosphaeraceae bacterium]
MNELINWRWFEKYGGGPLGDLGSHQIDIFSWFLGGVNRHCRRRQRLLQIPAQRRRHGRLRIPEQRRHGPRLLPGPQHMRLRHLRRLLRNLHGRRRDAAHLRVRRRLEQRLALPRRLRLGRQGRPPQTLGRVHQTRLRRQTPRRGRKQAAEGSPPEDRQLHRRPALLPASEAARSARPHAAPEELLRRRPRQSQADLPGRSRLRNRRRRPESQRRNQERR